MPTPDIIYESTPDSVRVTISEFKTTVIEVSPLSTILLIVVYDLNKRGGDNKIVLKASIVFVSVLSFIVKVLLSVLIAVTYVLILNKSSIAL